LSLLQYADFAFVSQARATYHKLQTTSSFVLSEHSQLSMLQSNLSRLYDSACFAQAGQSWILLVPCGGQLWPNSQMHICIYSQKSTTFFVACQRHFRLHWHVMELLSIVVAFSTRAAVQVCKHKCAITKFETANS